MSDIESKPAVPANLPIVAGAHARAIVPTSLDEVRKIANTAVQSGLMGYVKNDDEGRKKHAQATLIQLQGLELGLTPMQAFNGIAIVNGRTCVWGKLARALVRQAGHKIDETVENYDTPEQVNTCTITRGDTGEVITRRWSVKDAIRAGLWSPNPTVLKKNFTTGKMEEVPNDAAWHRYPQRMMAHRPFGYAAADGCPEALLGMTTAEEMHDLPPQREQDLGAVQAEPAPPPPMAPPPPARDIIETIMEIMPPEIPPRVMSGAYTQEMTEEFTAEQFEGPQPVDGAGPELAQDADDGLVRASDACLTAMGKATTVARLDQLKAAFDEKFDGRIPSTMDGVLTAAYEANAERIYRETIG